MGNSWHIAVTMRIMEMIVMPLFAAQNGPNFVRCDHPVDVKAAIFFSRSFRVLAHGHEHVRNSLSEKPREFAKASFKPTRLMPSLQFASLSTHSHHTLHLSLATTRWNTCTALSMSLDDADPYA